MVCSTRRIVGAKLDRDGVLYERALPYVGYLRFPAFGRAQPWRRAKSHRHRSTSPAAANRHSGNNPAV
jgi:hypothetical protein